METPAADEPREPCPAPLAWQDVLAAFRAESEPWSLEREDAFISGRVCGSGPPLYFLNGLIGSHESFALLVWLLRDEFRCVLYDDPPRKTGTVEDHVRDLCAVADAHGDGRFDVFATGFGGLVALADGEGRIARAVIQGGYAHRRLSLMERILIRLGRWTSRPLRDVPMLRTILRANHLPWFPPFDHSRYDFFESDALATPVRDAARRANALRTCDLRPRLSAIAAPVLLVRTEGEGRAATRCQQELEAALPCARTEWMHRSGQAPFLTHPHRVAKLVREFLAQSAGGRKALSTEYRVLSTESTCTQLPH
ncbi:MAG: alpha/beta hydrolase [Planctomycetales bacterium]